MCSRKRGPFKPLFRRILDDLENLLTPIGPDSILEAQN
jgi:hypothetical protein